MRRRRFLWWLGEGRASGEPTPETKIEDSTTLELHRDALLHEFETLRREIEFNLARWERTQALMVAILTLITGAILLRGEDILIDEILSTNYWWFAAATIPAAAAPLIVLDATVNIYLAGRYIMKVLAPQYSELLRLADETLTGRQLRAWQEKLPSYLRGGLRWEEFRHEELFESGLYKWMLGSWYIKEGWMWLPAITLMVFYVTSLIDDWPLETPWEWAWQGLWCIVILLLVGSSLAALKVAHQSPGAGDELMAPS